MTLILLPTLCPAATIEVCGQPLLATIECRGRLEIVAFGTVRVGRTKYKLHHSRLLDESDQRGDVGDFGLRLTPTLGSPYPAPSTLERHQRRVLRETETAVTNLSLDPSWRHAAEALTAYEQCHGAFTDLRMNIQQTLRHGMAHAQHPDYRLQRAEDLLRHAHTGMLYPGHALRLAMTLLEGNRDDPETVRAAVEAVHPELTDTCSHTPGQDLQARRAALTGCSFCAASLGGRPLLVFHQPLR